MVEYWKNNYIMKFDSPDIDIPVGTMFTITGVRGNQVELTATDETKGYAMVTIGSDVLSFGFTCDSEPFYQSFVLNSSLLDKISQYIYKKQKRRVSHVYTNRRSKATRSTT